MAAHKQRVHTQEHELLKPTSNGDKFITILMFLDDTAIIGYGKTREEAFNKAKGQYDKING